jgi:hypothetical protein
MNCIYWDARFPRLLTKREMKRLAEEGKDRYVVAFVGATCDVAECTRYLQTRALLS